MMNKLKLLSKLALTLAFLAAAGCATIEGAGKDVEAAGEAIQDSVDN